MPRRVYPLTTMELGDSFLAPISKLESLTHILSFFHRRKYPLDRFVIVRYIQSFRCWKIEGVCGGIAVTFYVEPNVPIPIVEMPSSMFPLRRMAVGDSFALRGEERLHLKKLFESCSRYKRFGRGEWTVRKIDAQTHRCWRVA